MKTSVTIQERGWPGHFIAALSCRYRRNTLVSEPGGKFVISTVGNYWAKDEKLNTIGAGGRYYETMVFRTRKEGSYTEADVDQQVSDYDGKWSICAKSSKQLPKDVDNRADKMHDATVAFYAKLAKRKR